MNSGFIRTLMAEPEECARYEAAWAAAEPIRAVEGGCVAYLTDVPGQYLDDAKRCGAFSAWFPGVLAAENLPRLLHYWELFPDRVPEFLVIGTEDAPAAELLLRELEARGWREFGSGGGFLLLRAEEMESMP